MEVHGTMCNDVHCKDINHRQKMDELLITILELINTTAYTCLPSPPQKKRKIKTSITDWKNEVEPYRDKAMFWHAVWLSAGRPINTELHRIMKRSRNIYHFQIRKQKKAANILKRNTLLAACIEDKGDLFEEIKKMRRSPPTISSTIDGVSNGIEEHFAHIYSDLYNSVEDQGELMEINKQLNKMIDSSSMIEINKVTTELVAEAISRVNSNKTDPQYEFTSDCIKNAPVILCKKLAELFRMFIIHGYISSNLMISTLIPLVKDKLGDITSSNNYRSIALSSIILKIFDWVILLLYDGGLKTDELQFGFQEKTSTNMCSWLVLETIDHFTNNGSEVFVCVMDMKKAFDLVKQSLLFEKLIARKIPPVMLRLILEMYRKQTANVRWNNKISKLFQISNGVKQGAVLSPRLYCIYIDELFKELRRQKSGCWVDDMFCGIAGYADDLLLLAPSIDALQHMIKTCEEYARSHNLTFSTDPNPRKCKTKCLAVLKNDRDLRKLRLNGSELPWVKSSKHLGCTIEDNVPEMKKDLMEKRAVYINRVNELTQEFHFAHPLIKVRLNNIYNSSFYGSPLWNLFGEEAIRLEKTWNISMRIMLGLPRNSHKFFIEPLAETRHIMTSLYGRYINFANSLTTSTKTILRKMVHRVKKDCRTNTGRNLRRLMLLSEGSNVDNIVTEKIQKRVYTQIPTGEGWKIEIAKEIIGTLNGEASIDNFSRKEAKDLLQYIVTS